MHFPDHSHINRIRDALWQRSAGATVMVGAGFSRNAARKRPDGLPMPTWRELVEAMIRRLYPQHDKKQQAKYARVASSETSGALRLAQEYKDAFGSTDLHGLLRDAIRDDEFRPGRRHKRLLRLPWRDVFTTNWDTLLENASSFVPERSYSIMRSMDEIPLAPRPRIVKLHGSVDARFPLIVTEEDYRTYPDQFAPFVNTVQQAMMETVFCLIGFSGDDPNFLHWSGWVRDNLGDSAPKIYLAGWLDLSIHRRRMLEKRNVVPIDLAKHPKADEWPEHLHHDYSTEWILYALETGRPYDPAEWPIPSTRENKSVPSYLEPLDRTPFNSPKAEPQIPSSNNQSDQGHLDAVRNLIEVWTYNRAKTYPGWLAAPADVRQKMYSTTEHASDVLKEFPKLSTVERLNALREIIWRYEIQLEPISALESTSEKLELAATDILSQIDCKGRKIQDTTALEADWSAIREAWVVVASALVTAARFRFSEDEFWQRVSDLSIFGDEYQDVAHRIRHEKCLWAIYALDYNELESLLKDWHTEDCDPAWTMRKAALLFEIGQNTRAEELNSAALTEIRSASQIDGSVAILSRESWALCCSGATMDWKEFWQASTEWQHRWDELTQLKCNPRLELDYCAVQIKGKETFDKGKPFDLGTTWAPGISFSREGYLRWAASHRAIRLTELAGLPPLIQDRRVASGNLEIAAQELSPNEPELAARLVLRAVNDETKGTINFVFSRARIAMMPSECVKNVVDICLRAIRFMLPRIDISESGQHWLKRLPVIVESLSRFVLRLDPSRVDSILVQSLSWYENRAIGSSLKMANPIRNILSRCWEALPEDMQTKRLLHLLGAPVVGMDGLTAGVLGSHGERMFVDQYPDPCELLYGSENLSVTRVPDDEARWREATSLLSRALQQSGPARKRAARRIHWLVLRNLLTEDEGLEIGRALWGDAYSSHNKLPTGTELMDWVFLVLPEPVSGISEQRFRTKWLRSNALNESNGLICGVVLWQVGSAVCNLEVSLGALELSNKERSYLAEVIGRWAEEPLPISVPVGLQSAPIFLEGADRDAKRAISGLQYILWYVDVSEAVANTLYEKSKSLNMSKIFTHLVLGGLTKVLPGRFNDVVQLIRSDLVSDDRQAARSAATALQLWMQFGNNTAVEAEPPPTSLVQEIGVIISTRRKVALIAALEVARWVFSKGSREQRDAIEDLTLRGLGYLTRELQYDVENDEDIDVPLLRWACTHLAIAMAAQGLATEAAVSSWIDEASNDPLPEIRYAKQIESH